MRLKMIGIFIFVMSLSVFAWTAAAQAPAPDPAAQAPTGQSEQGQQQSGNRARPDQGRMVEDEGWRHDDAGRDVRALWAYGKTRSWVRRTLGEGIEVAGGARRPARAD